MTVRRGTSNSNVRGSASTRRIRKQWLLDTFGDGTEAVCTFCPEMLTFETITVDRIIPGIEGGTYARDNIRPSCMKCASKQGADMSCERRKLSG